MAKEGRHTCLLELDVWPVEAQLNAPSSYPISKTEACRIVIVRGCQCVNQAIGQKDQRDRHGQ
eukprot:UN10784